MKAMVRDEYSSPDVLELRGIDRPEIVTSSENERASENSDHH
jgi:hypothetical protein